MRSEDYHSLRQLFSEKIKGNSNKQSTFLIGIDGCGGSGKSTFADKIKENFSDVTIVHMDDFYLPSSLIMNLEPTKKPIGADFDWIRLLNQVLEPLTQDSVGCYQRYDWETDSLAKWHTVPIGGIVIIEGVYTIRKELADKYDLKIWVNSPRNIRLSRGLERDGEEAREMWESNWMVSEDMYVAEHKPFERADLIVSGVK
ncbi:uridine kinase [Lysinibacillus sp. 2017]|uniref:uridine kinase family protein n=1 Tax=unclassified Lysinibacillus TaxID=2636778 RepID=UPI000D527BAF|nr:MULTISPECIES: uridine kinase [unclassified Lysinibacillus]AWE07792.1 uridine kinase [Lysinibacillus sp. 2017]TGN34612.1 uridine kinase [Lysinibacillus sp. S2017]